MDYTGLGENLASLFAHTKPRWLVPGGRVIPARLRLYAFLVEWPFPRVHKDVDLSPLEPFVCNARYARFCSMGGTDSVPAALSKSKDWYLMSDIVEFLDLDLQSLSHIAPEGPRPVIFHATQSGIVNAVAWFFVCDLDDEVSICTAPVSHPAFESFGPVHTHWYQAMQSVGPFAVIPGQEVHLGFKHDGVCIDWLAPRDESLAHGRLARRLFERAGVPAATVEALEGWFHGLLAKALGELPPVRERVRAALRPADTEEGAEQRRWLLRLISQLGELGHSTTCTERLLGLCCAPPPPSTSAAVDAA
uniref:Uncharacterized protein n=1 Tax=Alexandrium monilatum TaxID=311494 RepID=A0A7S4Q0A7_9DINO